MTDKPGGNARFAALRLLIAVLDRGTALDAAMARVSTVAGRDRAFAHILAATCLRRLGQIDDVLGRCLARPLPERAGMVRHTLRLGIAQLLFLGTPAHAAVDTTVGLIAGSRLDAYRGLVNALMRRVARDGPAWVAAQDAARLNTPPWLWRSWVAAYGEVTARAIGERHLVEPPLDLAAVRDPAAWAGRLDGTVLPTGTVRLATHGAIEALPGYDAGGWWVQDAAAALPVRLLGDVAGRTVLDLCAAPGGKTMALATAGARVVAVDRSAARLALLRANLARCGLVAEVVQGELAQWRPDAPATHILLDAPCTGTGTIRRHPDLPHLKSAADVPRLVALQAALLDTALAWLAPGGTLVYSVCSLEAAEGPGVVAAALAAHPELRRLPVDPGEIGGLVEAVDEAGDLRTLPCHLAAQGGMDGFYAARLRRQGQAAT